MSSEFEKLAAELEVLAKAQPATEEDKVLAAAKEAGVDTDQVGDTPDDADGVDGPDGDEDEDDEVLGKSFQAVDADGQSVKAYDATDLIKSLDARIVGVQSLMDADNQSLTKSLTLMADMLKSQSEQIDVLQKAMVNMSKQGAGRKAILTVNEKPEPAMMKSAQSGMNTETFMMKANAAFNAGRISGKDLTVCDVSLRHNEAIDAGLINKIFAD
jgi:hypothetical protein